jgi:hypothetical protein
VNPSLRDYLNDYLNDTALLSLMAPTAQKVDWAKAIWQHVRFQPKRFSPADQKALAMSFLPFVDKMLVLPVLKPDPQRPHVSTFYDTDVSDRIDLLLTWFACSGEERFAFAALALAKKPVQGYTPWQDSRKLVELAVGLRDEDFAEVPCREELVKELEEGIVGLLEGGMYPDDLESLASSIEIYEDKLGEEVVEALHNAIISEIDNAKETARAVDSEHTLADHAKSLQKLGASIGVPAERIGQAVEVIQSRIAEIEANAQKASSPSFTGRMLKDTDTFDDAALRNLFLPLVGDH